VGDGQNKRISGIGGIIVSEVDETGSLFLLQMVGSERSAEDVDSNDRLYSSYEFVRGPSGYVCIGTKWSSILEGGDPERIVERCSLELKSTEEIPLPTEKPTGS